MNIKRKPIKEDHNLANSWKAAGEKHTENYKQFKKDLAPIINDIRKDGINTLQGIADELTKRKVKTKNWKNLKKKDQPIKWYPSQVRNYLEK